MIDWPNALNLGIIFIAGAAKDASLASYPGPTVTQQFNPGTRPHPFRATIFPAIALLQLLDPAPSKLYSLIASATNKSTDISTYGDKMLYAQGPR